MTVNTVKTYEIGGKTYEQRRLVFGQWQQLLRLFKGGGAALPELFGARELILALGDKLDTALAVVLTEQGQSPRDKDMEALADELAFEMLPEQVAEVFSDFFDCNPLASIAQAIGEAFGGLLEKLQDPNGSSEPSSSSPEGTGPSATPSSGAASR